MPRDLVPERQNQTESAPRCTQALDALYKIAAAHDTAIRLRRDRVAARWVASIAGAGSADALTANGAVRALADKLAAPHLVLCQQEDTHG